MSKRWRKTQNRIGEEFITLRGELVKIIDYAPYINCTIQFEDNTILKNVTYDNLQKGWVKNRNKPTIVEIGYIGIGTYPSSINNKDTNSYIVWNHMIKRCYDEKNFIKFPTYKDCSVVEEWHNYQNFAKWYEENYVEGFELDKDILVKGNRVYGPTTCCFVPREINRLFTCRKQNIFIREKKNNKYAYRVTIGINNKRTSLGSYDSLEKAQSIYNDAKNLHIRSIAEKYKDRLKLNVYNTLMNYIWK